MPKVLKHILILIVICVGALFPLVWLLLLALVNNDKTECSPQTYQPPDYVYPLQEDIPEWRLYTGTLMYLPPELKQQYLLSIEWQELKAERSTIANGTCEVEGCTETEHLHLHHTDYERLTMEHIDDLRLLCPFHHSEVHKKLGKDRATKYPIQEKSDEN